MLACRRISLWQSKQTSGWLTLGTLPSWTLWQESQDTALAARFVLQVGAFGVQKNAEALKDRFEAFGYPVEMISRVKDTRALFLVWVGNYSTHEEARTAGQEVKRKMGVDAIVISR